jgi:sugar phosphate isomerase/epimerase
VCTHVHDNKSSADLHQPAFAGTLPLEEVFTILKKNGYAGNLTWEMVYGRYPDELLPDFLKLLHKSGEYLDAL